jgi:transcriptional repressor NrdR
LVDVVKKRGTREPFDMDKIKKSIDKAAIDANYTLEEIKTLTEEIIRDITEEGEKIGELDTEAIRTSIFNTLDENESSIVESWKKFDARYKP